MTRGLIADWFAALLLVTVIYVLVRPQSKAAEFVDLFAKAMTALVRTVTDM